MHPLYAGNETQKQETRVSLLLQYIRMCVQVYPSKG